MTGFIAVAVLLTAAVLGLLLYPLLARERRQSAGSASELSIAVLRDQLGELDEQRKAGLLDSAVFVEEKAELERRALEDGTAASPGAGDTARRRPALAALVGVGVPVLAIGFYLWLGNPEALQPQAGHAGRGGEHGVTAQQVEEMVAKLARKLEESPDNGDGWLMLARSYAALGRYPQSAEAYARAAKILPPSAGLLADQADMLAMAQGGNLAGEPEKLIARALQLDPRHIKSLALSGSAAFDRGDFAGAIKDWRTLQSVAPPDSEIAASIGESLAEAERMLGVPGKTAGVRPAAEAKPVADSKSATSGKASVSGTVTLAPELAAKLPADATLFVFARNPDGPRMPLAMTRIKPAKLPFSFKLDDSMAMVPNAGLSSVKTVVIGARISLSGDALPKLGDLEGYSDPVPVGASSVSVKISTAVR